MPAPTNLTPASAIDLGTLPASTSQDVHDAGTTYSVWYRYTATDDDVLLGVFGFGNLSGFSPRTQVYDNVAALPANLIVGGTGTSVSNRPVQWAAVPGTTYYIKFNANTGNPTPAILLIEAYTASVTSVPIGSIAVNDDTHGFPLVLIDSATGEVARVVSPYPAGEAGDILNDGTSLVHNDFDEELTVYDDQYNAVIVIPSINLSSQGGAIRTCQGTQRWWIAYTGNPSGVSASYVDPDGTIGTAHVLTTFFSVTAIAASNDETILYHTGGGVGQRAIKRWDLVNDVALSDLAAEVSGYYTFDILVLSDDTIITSVIDGTGSPDVQVRHYATNGTLLHTYNFGGDFVFPAGTQPRLAYAIDDPDSFWIWTHPDGADEGLSRFEEIDVATGAVLNTVESTEYEGGVYNRDPTATPSASFGNSFSCPFWITRTVFPLTSGVGTIRVVKVTIPDSDETSFDFVAGGGLSPTTFSLTGGNEQVYNSVPADDGYSVIETPNVNYQTTVTVSNGSPNTNITVAEDEIVVVTFTNSAVHTPGFNTRAVKRRWLRRSPIYSTQNARVRWNMFQLDCQVGSGNTVEPGKDPQVYLSYSDDWGETWSFVIPMAMGPLGQYDVQLQWWRLGVGRDRVFEVYGSDPVKVALLDGFARVDPGTD